MIQRYSINPDETGEFVRYTDHLAEIEQKGAEIADLKLDLAYLAAELEKET